jgi:hypothetical protein
MDGAKGRCISLYLHLIGKDNRYFSQEMIILELYVQGK